MPNKALEIFYLFFQGILVFQVLIFLFLHFITLKKDILYYSLFLLFATVYFFVNAPYTFFGIPEETVWASAWYDHFNTPVVIVENLFYLLFIKTFFRDLTADSAVNKILSFTLWLIPVLVVLFIVLSILQVNKQFIFYAVKMMSVLPAAIVAFVIIKKKVPFASLVAKGLFCTVAGTTLTVCMIIMANNGVRHLFTVGYPLFFIRLGILGDMIFYLVAILKKWHWQEKQLEVEKLQGQLAVEKLRNKISGELHDDIGSNLSGISMYSYLVNDLINAGKYKQATESLSVIQQSATEMSQSLNELVWTMNTEKDNVEDLLEKLQDYACKMAAAKEVQIKMNVPGKSLLPYLPVEHRRNIYLLCKEAINNALKYSSATQLEVTMKKNGDGIEFVVQDNGQGFNPGTVKRGNGLNNMQKRADEIGAVLTIHSGINEGTSLHVYIKSPKR